MQHRILLSVLVVVLIVGVTGCSTPRSEGPEGQNIEKAAPAAKTPAAQPAEKKETPAQQVALAQVPEPARAAIEKLTAGGKIQKIEKAQEEGKTIYDVEATVRGVDVEYDVAADGTVLTRGQSVPYASLPRAVQNAAEKYFGSATGLKASVEVEGEKTFYEVGGPNGKALKLSDTGQIVEEENE
jgi:uncharacterized membrane protein YkoI